MIHRALTCSLLVIFSLSLMSAAQSGGTIAYVRGSTEIRLINPDGSSDRRLWTHKDLNEDLGIFGLAWRPDGAELAFSSAHEATASLFLADIYGIRPDGSGLRRITNPPLHDDLGRFPKGSVTVTVKNDQPGSTTYGTFIVYVAGADMPQQVTIPSGTSKTVVFKSVADFGSRRQPVTAMYAKFRWYAAGVDVVPGRNVSAALTISDVGYEMFGAFRPDWRSDGSRISFRDGLCLVSSVSAQQQPGEWGYNPMFGGKPPSGACNWEWGPTPATANKIIYTDNSSDGSNIYEMTEGGTHPGTKLTQFTDLANQLLYDLEWMPDASGLMYSTVNLYRDSANIFRYDFATKKTTQVTRLEKEFAREFSISPDGRSVVFERCPTADEEKGCDLWITGSDGRGAHLLIRNGLRPDWGK